jgi:hypothetical protein
MTKSISLTPKPINYLQNRVLLEEIHKSKTSYCWFELPEYHQYDAIIERDTLEDSLAAIEGAVELATANYLERIGITPAKTDLIFRVMSTDHIPTDALANSSKRARNKASRQLEEDWNADDEDEDINAGINFPPFHHYKYDDNNNLRCVGRSHWQDGKFSSTHGKVTNNLARAWLQLCDRYSTKYNFRGYSYIDEMRANALIQLTMVGLKFNEARSDNPFAYMTAIVNNAFIRILNKEKTQSEIVKDLREAAGLGAAFDRQAGAE